MNLTPSAIRSRKHGLRPILAAYDASTARLVEQAGVDAILIGDSLEMVVLGYATTVPVTMVDSLRHCRAARRGAAWTHVLADLAFLLIDATPAVLGQHPNVRIGDVRVLDSVALPFPVVPL